MSVSQARVDVNATAVEVIIPASNNPYGTVELPSDPITTAEGSGPVQVLVTRAGGLIGALRVNFTAILNSANNTDFRIGDSCKSFWFPQQGGDSIFLEHLGVRA